jgi:3-deoxy-D-manno-octulosonic-acid transferase
VPILASELSTEIPRSRGASRLLDLLYLGAAFLLIPYFLWRKLIRRKLSAGLSAKLGNVPARESEKPCVWIHAVSVGEAQAAEPLVAALRGAINPLEIIVSTTTVTGQEVARKRFGAENVVYYPHDFSFSVKRFLDRVRPSVIVLMELEVWPNLTAEAGARGIPIIVVNARITERSADRYRKFWFLVGPAFLRVRQWLAQSDEYAWRLNQLGVNPQRIEVCGNIKYDAIKTNLPAAAERRSRRGALGLPLDATVLIGGSTHPTEEAVLIRAYMHLRANAEANLRLILVPRHPERAKDVLAECQSTGLTVIPFTQIRERGIEACIAELDPKVRGAWVLLVDTVGELNNMYAVSDVAFVGGSLIPHGGQNVMEPCGLGVAVVHGPHMHNFNEAMTLLRSCNGSIEITRETLSSGLETLLKDKAGARVMSQRAREVFLKQQGGSKKTVDCIAELLKRADQRRR